MSLVRSLDAVLDVLKRPNVIVGNAMLSDQQEFLDAGADRYAASLIAISPMTERAFRVLVKPVFECSLVDMLMFAQQRRVQGDSEEMTA